MILIGVTGGRDFSDRIVVLRAMHAVMAEHVGEDMVVFVHGDCETGADAHCRAICEAEGWHEMRVPAHWKAIGKAAGPIRNSLMAELPLAMVLAFPGGRGTADMIKKARSAGIPIEDMDR